MMRARRRYGIAILVLLAVASACLLWRYGPWFAPAPRPIAARRPSPAPSRVPPPKPEPAPAAQVPSPPQRLANPPAIIKGVYFTCWSAGIASRIDYLLELRRTTPLNAVVIDIKDYSGFIAYRTAVPDAKRYHAIRVSIRDLDGLIARLHRENIYVIARITVFQDPILAAARPEIAVHRVSTSELWLDRKGLAWVDPASRDAWDYNVAIAADASTHAFDELNFDYVRFPSDGDLNDMEFPLWDGKTPKHSVIQAFFAYLRSKLPPIRVSGDLFGLSTVSQDDLGIGQVIEDGFAGFDFVCPMVYPSHFAPQFMGFANPAEHPYEVVNHSMQSALARLDPAGKAKLRPWLQDFNLGARYDTAMVKAQIKAVQDALGDRYAGYMLWSSQNLYTRDALE